MLQVFRKRLEIFPSEFLIPLSQVLHMLRVVDIGIVKISRFLPRDLSRYKSIKFGTGKLKAGIAQLLFLEQTMLRLFKILKTALSQMMKIKESQEKNF